MLGLLLVLWLSVQLLVSFWITPVFNAVFKESVSRYSDGLYQVQYDHLAIKPVAQTVQFSNFRLSFDSLKVQQIDSLQQRKWVQLRLDEFTLSLSNLWSMIPDRYLHIDELSMNDPEMVLYDYGKSASDSLEFKDLSQFDAHSLIERYFDSLKVDQMDIQELKIQWKKEQELFSIDGVSAAIEDLIINQRTKERNYGYPDADKFVVKLKDFSILSRDSLYRFSLAGAVADPVREELVFAGFSVEPQQQRYTFARKLGYQKERIELQVDTLRMERINLHHLISERAFLVGKINVQHPDLVVFKDKRLPRASDTLKPLLPSLLMQVPFPFRLDTLQLRQGRIAYQEHVEQGQSAGEITFEEVYTTAYNITNIERLWQEDLIMEADVETRFMGKSLLSLNMDFPLNHPQQRHRIQGEMLQFSIPDINTMLEPTAFTSVESGFVDTLRFIMTMDERQSSGDMQFIYRDFKVQLLNKDASQEEGLKEDLASLLANWLVIKKDNPDQSGKPIRVGKIAFVREPEKSVFAYWWKSLLSGFKSSVGMKSDASQTKQEEDKPGLIQRIFGKSEE